MLSLLVGNPTATIVFYLIAIALDAVLFAVWLRRAFRYSRRASRGETFSLRPAHRQTATRGIPVKH
ncbi:MAG TPA: hypothetical protein VIO32_08695 [Candidatus Baltobacteraceae bacterium]